MRKLGILMIAFRSSDASTLVMIAEESFTFDETRVFFALAE